MPDSIIARVGAKVAGRRNALCVCLPILARIYQMADDIVTSVGEQWRACRRLTVIVGQRLPRRLNEIIADARVRVGPKVRR